ncbi:oligosaccharide repeat unit polymerase [Anaerobranca gottschalkii]|uniref:Oligosaccharide repeat unit polymerase n=1 Tax=Anaerobranca gottschalkii DSM 13577 TaxID=1120990 RepID=A0A1I0CTD7_9FIRM|nr:oligosaccharide repeat unit polymerase [Anaerobranca gottschalkii]SET22350.1 hypothetical protein SAMN03080614_10895 [Anaerobranca gottschalkii DSM 13577]
MLNIKKNNIIAFFCLIFYKLILDAFYIFFIHKYYEYMGFSLDFNGYKYLLSLMFIIILFTFLPKDSQKPSSIFLQLHLIVMFIPMLTIYAFMNESTNFMLINVLAFLSQCILINLMPNIKIARIKNSKKLLYLLLCVITIFVYLSMIRANGLPSLKTLNILNVYDVRSNVAYPFLMNYLVNWQAKVINPFLITVAYLRGSRNFLMVFVFLQIIIYMITAHKSFLFMPMAIIIVCYILKKVDFLKLSTIVSAISSFIILIHYFISKSILVSSIFIRRFLFVPAHIKFSYYDFFTNNSFLYFSLGRIGNIFGINYPYDKKIANLIGEVYYNSPNMWVNTGYLADAYANMGYWGIFFISILFVLVLKVIDSLSIKVGKELTVGLALFPILSLNDGAFLTTLFTGGLLFTILVLFLYSK